MDLALVLERLRPGSEYGTLGPRNDLGSIVWRDQYTTKPTLQECEGAWAIIQAELDSEAAQKADDEALKSQGVADLDTIADQSIFDINYVLSNWATLSSGDKDSALKDCLLIVMNLLRVMRSEFRG